MYLGIDSVHIFNRTECNVLKNQLGVSFIGRYLWSTPGKGITLQEAQDIHSEGLAILLFFENNWDDYFRGSISGAEYGDYARKQAQSLGVPNGTCIYFCCDPASDKNGVGHPNSNDFNNIEAYLRAARQHVSPYSCGVYGPLNVMQMAKERNLCDCYCECCGGSRAADYSIIVPPHVNVVQTKCSIEQQSIELTRNLQELAKSSIGGVDMEECPDLLSARLWMPSSTSFSSGRNKVLIVGDSSLSSLRQNATADENTTFLNNYYFTDVNNELVLARVTSDIAVCVCLSKEASKRQDAQFYITKLNDLSKKVSGRGGSTYVVSANPEVPKATYGMSAEARTGPVYAESLFEVTTQSDNVAIQEFNQAVRNGLDSSIGYIDTYSMIMSNYNDREYESSQAYKDAYQMILNSACSHSYFSESYTMYDSPSDIGGVSVEVDYTKINPYIITFDRNTDTKKIDFDKLQENGVVGAILEYGALYDAYHLKYNTYKQPKFEEQKKLLDSHNLEYGYLVTTRARSTEEAASELNELIPILRTRPPRLGVWVKLDLSISKERNNAIISAYQKCLISLGFKKKIGLLTTREDAEKKFTWTKFQDEWLLWVDEHVKEESELKQLLKPDFFDIDLST